MIRLKQRGMELPFKKKKKLPQRSSGLAKTSGTASKRLRRKLIQMTSFENVREIRGK